MILITLNHFKMTHSTNWRKIDVLKCNSNSKKFHVASNFGLFVNLQLRSVYIPTPNRSRAKKMGADGLVSGTNTSLNYSGTSAIRSHKQLDEITL